MGNIYFKIPVCKPMTQQKKEDKARRALYDFFFFCPFPFLTLLPHIILASHHLHSGCLGLKPAHALAVRSCYQAGCDGHHGRERLVRSIGDGSTGPRGAHPRHDAWRQWPSGTREDGLLGSLARDRRASKARLVRTQRQGTASANG